MFRVRRSTLPILLLLALLRPSPAAGAWAEILHLQDGHYNNAARIDYDAFGGQLRMTWKWQIDTDSNTRQIAAGTYGGSPTPTWSFDDLTTATSSKEYPDIAVSPDGVAHVVWREHLGGGNWQVLYTDDRTGVWAAPTQLTFDATVKGSPVVAAPDATGLVHIAYSTLETGTTNDEIWYLLYDSVADTTAFLQLTSDSDTDDDVTIDATPDGVVSVAWVVGILTGAIHCMEGDLDGFVEIPTGVTASAAKPDLELDSDDRQHIAYRHTITSGSRVIRYLRRQGAGFAAPVDASPADAFYSEPSILVAGGAFPAIAYVSNTAGHKGLYVSEWDGSQFASPDTVHADEAVTYNETDFDGQPISVGLPRRARSQAFLVTSTGYVDGTVQADLHVFSGTVEAVSAPVVADGGAPTLSLAAHPSPFRGGTTIRYTLPVPAADVHLDVHDVAGRRVERIARGAEPAGPQQVAWNPGDLPSGVYWIRVSADDRRDVIRVHRVR